MIGEYDQFPSIQHGLARFSYNTSTENLQKALVRFMYLSNQEPMELKTLNFSRYKIKVETEIGIADGLTFTYVDLDVRDYYLSRIRESILEILDFLTVVRYYRISKSCRRSLRFDYFLLRFTFKFETTNLRIYHDRGPRRLSVRQLVEWMVLKVNKELMMRKMGEMQATHIRTV